MENTIIIMADLEYSIAQKQTYKVFVGLLGDELVSVMEILIHPHPTEK